MFFWVADKLFNFHKPCLFILHACYVKVMLWMLLIARNTEADSYTAMTRMACNKSRWKAACQSKDWRTRRRRRRRWRRWRRWRRRRRKSKQEDQKWRLFVSHSAKQTTFSHLKDAAVSCSVSVLWWGIKLCNGGAGRPFNSVFLIYRVVGVPKMDHLIVL